MVLFAPIVVPTDPARCGFSPHASFNEVSISFLTLFRTATGDVGCLFSDAKPAYMPGSHRLFDLPPPRIPSPDGILVITGVTISMSCTRIERCVGRWQVRAAAGVGGQRTFIW